MKPLLRWAGSKRAALPQIAPVIPNTFNTYVEPFCGSATIFFYLEPRIAILSDQNSDLINFYLQIRKDPSLIQFIADTLPRDRDFYYRARAHLKTCHCPTERAILFFYLNRNCFNGLYRTDRQGFFNVPFAASRTGTLPDQATCMRAAELLSHAVVLKSDFAAVVRDNLKPGTLFFLDPPYVVARRKPFTDYTAHGFSDGDLTRLLDCLEEIDDAGAMFMMTFDAQLQDRIHVRHSWRRIAVSVRRSISGFAGSRTNSAEVLLVNF